mmetsp:Transcript_17390/g.52069  ORF Transcript_17390/g.52069 Transcript_17390/m.52069 type:complete len:396 (+) Transcript_17390:97-1284(+)
MNHFLRKVRLQQAAVQDNGRVRCFKPASEHSLPKHEATAHVQRDQLCLQAPPDCSSCSASVLSSSRRSRCWSWAGCCGCNACSDTPASSAAVSDVPLAARGAAECWSPLPPTVPPGKGPRSAAGALSGWPGCEAAVGALSRGSEGETPSAAGPRSEATAAATDAEAAAAAASSVRRFAPTPSGATSPAGPPAPAAPGTARGACSSAGGRWRANGRGAGRSAAAAAAAMSDVRAAAIESLAATCPRSGAPTGDVSSSSEASSCMTACAAAIAACRAALPPPGGGTCGGDRGNALASTGPWPYGPGDAGAICGGTCGAHCCCCCCWNGGASPPPGPALGGTPAPYGGAPKLVDGGMLPAGGTPAGCAPIWGGDCCRTGCCCGTGCWCCCCCWGGGGG